MVSRENSSRTPKSPTKDPNSFFLTPEDTSFDKYIEKEEQKNKWVSWKFWKSMFNFRFLNLLTLSFCFTLVFAGHNVCGNMMTAVHGDVGAVALGLLCLTFAVSNLFTPTIIQIFGSKYSIFLGHTFRCLFVLAVSLPTPKSENGYFANFGRQLYAIYGCLNSESETQILVKECLIEKSTDFILSNYAALIIFVVSACLGATGALAWSAEGVYITSIAYDPVTDKTESGFFSGTFFSIFGTNLIFGNVVVAVLLYFNISIYVVFLCMFFVVALGTLSSLLLYPYQEHLDAKKNAKKLAKKQAYRMKHQYTDIEMQDKMPKTFSTESFTSIEETEEKGTSKLFDIKRMFDFRGLLDPKKIREKIFDIVEGCKDSIANTYSCIVDKRMLMMGPLLIYTGVAASFMYGVLPAATHNPQWITFAFLAFGIAELFANVTIGKCIDIFGKRLFLYFSIFLHGIAVSSSFDPIFFLTGRPVWVPSPTIENAGEWVTQGNPISIIASFFVWGVADAAMTTSLYALIPAKSMFADKVGAGFSVMKLYTAGVQSFVFFAIMFFKRSLIVFQVTLFVLMALGTCSCILLEVLFIRFDDPVSTEENEGDTPKQSLLLKLKGKIGNMLPFLKK